MGRLKLPLVVCIVTNTFVFFDIFDDVNICRVNFREIDILTNFSWYIPSGVHMEGSSYTSS